MLVIAHISDLHFNCTAHNRERAQAVMDYINERSYDIDIILATGDITDRGTAAEYEEAAAVAHSSVPLMFTPGNHDMRSEFAYSLLGKNTGENPVNTKKMVGGALFLAVDSSIPDADAGYLDDQTINWMDRQLSRTDPDVPVFVAFHHPPVLMQMEFMDSIRQTGEQRLAELVAKYPNIVAFMCGHTHTGSVTRFADRPLCLAPGVSSTLNLPWEGSDIINLTQPPGFFYHVYADGQFYTHYRSVPVG